MKRWTDEHTRRLAHTGLLFALCCAFSLAESALSGWVGLPPGVRPGLANVVVMYALFFLGRRPAAALVLLKAAFGALTRGLTAGFLSLCGGGLALLALCILQGVGGGRFSWATLSICGALAHNIGQLAGIRLWLGRTIWYYLPVLLVSGVVCGLLCAAVLRLSLPALARAPLARQTPPEQGTGTRPQ